jgi:predicted NAD/FAD-binding protein
VKIAIVGAGVSGLVAAHLLHREHRIAVFEAADWIGGHTHTVPVQLGTASYEVDTGFIVLNDRNYPNFERLLAKLGVATQRSEMSFSVSNGEFEYSSTSVGGLFADPRHLVSPSFLRILADARRFQREARELLSIDGDGPSLGDYLDERGYSRDFVEKLIVPQASSVWSADPRQMWSFPARFLVEFFDNHGMLQLRGRPRWRAVAGGSRRYVEALIAPFRNRIRVSAPVARIARVGNGQVEVAPAHGEPEQFDRVVVATHSDQALRMLADASDREREILGSIPYQPNDVVLHTDASLLPRRRRAWASWNYHLGTNGRASAVTYHMNRLQALGADRELCVTLNMTPRIDPTTVLGSWTYEHPVYTPAGVAAQRRRREIDGVDRIHYCGAYWGWGFHEDGVVSALRTCEPLGGRL